MDNSESNRRPLRSRSSAWARRAAAGLAASAITPNQISVASVAFAAIGAAGLLWLPAPWSLLLCALCIQLRLLCNLLDGMVAQCFLVAGMAGSIVQAGRWRCFDAGRSDLPPFAAHCLAGRGAAVSRSSCRQGGTSYC